MSTLPPVALVLGGARSGKSRRAEALIAGELGRSCSEALYVATAEAGDAEMRARIAAHQARRGAHWRTLEVPLALAEALRTHAAPARPVLVDCLTLWLSNVMLADRDVATERAALLAALADIDGSVVLVANEVGLGIVPDNALGRTFRDAAGILNQEVAALADRVELVTAGLPLLLKGPPMAQDVTPSTLDMHAR